MLIMYLGKLVIQQKTANLAIKCNQFIIISNLNLSGFDILKPISYYSSPNNLHFLASYNFTLQMQKENFLVSSKDR